MHSKKKYVILAEQKGDNMIKICIVVCDRCGKEIDAKKETYIICDEEDICCKCYHGY